MPWLCLDVIRPALGCVTRHRSFQATAAARMAEITSTLDQTYFAWYGPTTHGSAAYFRITGPTLVIEYSPQQIGGDAAK
ncbi:MAG: DUF3500 domain-containing protein, partial [Roseiflexaceae bacterium]